MQFDPPHVSFLSNITLLHVVGMQKLLKVSTTIEKSSSSHKLVILFIVSSCYCFRARGIVSVVCSIVLSKGSKPFMSDLMRAATSPPQFEGF